MTTDPTTGQPSGNEPPGSTGSTSPPPPPPPPSDPAYPQYPSEQQPGGYPQYHAGQQPPPGYGRPQSSRNTWSIVAIVLGVLGAVIGPLFGAIGIGLSFLGRQRGERLWRTGLIVSIVGTVIGTALVAAYLNSR